MISENDLPQESYICSLIQTTITIKTSFEFTNIYYNLIKDEIARMEYFEYKSAIGIIFMNADDIE